ncbi:Oidioi.mRNA.OKI2018_I69.PAR.g8722.t1.cds [Oikopleura dioica]|uniref:Oidioi.mRNA.OKI2018_I69.PAR.g8722.t1.cds n=1 Tax=Oikopleura dioica TaxID=34765 RepID=A0ABN7RHB8_OIKDI|nr:Oidioi.mRNA.OKI2018_I69.PAR.g8722.t1.cds [Oikopleura dioica]
MRSQQEIEENQAEETELEDSKIEKSEEREMVESPKEEVLESTSNSPEIPSKEKSPEASETLISSPNSPKIPDSKPEPSFEPEPASEPANDPEPEAVVIIHEVSMGKTTEILENGQQRVSTSQQEDKFIETLVENQIEDAQPFDPQDPFVDDYDSDHTSLASDISYPELLDLITNLDSD